MRPVRRGMSPISGDYKCHKVAKVDLISRISLGESDHIQYGRYCSYCEMPVGFKNLAVEHIKFKEAPKDRPDLKKYERPDLKGRWSNFLLSCSTCNSVKGTSPVFFQYFLFPDRDNTFSVFDYMPDGEIKPNRLHRPAIVSLAINTLRLTGLNKNIHECRDANEKLIITERKQERMQAWIVAESVRDLYKINPGSSDIENLILIIMLKTGFFSIWMTVFKDCPKIKNLFINSISGTMESDCFDCNGDATNAHSNKDKLEVSHFKQPNDKI